MERHLNILPTTLAGVVVVDVAPNADHRGSFARWFCDRELESILGERHIVQINHSCTHVVGALRGMHYQRPPYAEMKFIRCLRGRVWDVALDLRCNSATFLQWHAEELSSESTKMLVIPEGCAHGFQVLESDSELLYLHTAHYNKDSEGGIRHDDPAINIRWPLAITDLSERDRNHLLVAKSFPGINT